MPDLTAPQPDSGSPLCRFPGAPGGLIALAMSLALAACGGESPIASPEPPGSSLASDAAVGGEAAPEDAGLEALEAQVSRMAAIGYAASPTFSPDGSRVAYITAHEGVPQVWLAAADGSERQPFTAFADQVTGVAWQPGTDEADGETSGNLAVLVAPGGGLNSQLYLVPADGSGEPRLITAGGQVNNWLTGWSDDGRYLTYSSNVDGGTGMDCWWFDTQTGEHALLVENDGIGACTPSPNNAMLVAWRMVSRGDTNLYLVDLATGEEQLLTPHVGVALNEDAAWVDDRTLVISTNVDREMIALARVDIDADGRAQLPEVIAGRDDADLSAMEVLAGGRLALLWNVAGRSELAYHDLGSGETIAGPELPAEVAGQLSASADGTALLMGLTGAAAPSNSWSLDVASGRFVQISDTPHPGVDLDTLVRPELRTYTAHDGLELSGWLYRAPGVEGPGPMVLSFHGGPDGQARPFVRASFQALLARGISVFDPNVRGSSGFGKTFVNLDNGALRFDGIRDIESTVKFVTGADLADPERIGIMGGSYGGYMVMAGLTEYPEAFAAGANLFGVVNFKTFFEQTEPWMAAISTVEYGDPVADAELLEQLSPINRVDRVVAPTIVLHGANDTNVPVVEAEQVVESLEQRGVPVQYVLFPDEGHGWRKTKNRIASDVAIVKWFAEHL